MIIQTIFLILHLNVYCMYRKKNIIIVLHKLKKKNDNFHNIIFIKALKKNIEGKEINNFILIFAISKPEFSFS